LDAPDTPPHARPEPHTGGDAAQANAPPSLDDARALTRARARDLRSLLSLYLRRHLPARPPRRAEVPEPPRLVGAHAKVLPYLRLVPLVLLLLFGISFVWDFPGVSLTLFGYTLPLEGLLLVVSVSGLIGFLTNWLAITMLFNPRERRPIFGQGLIPAQRDRVIFRLARAVSEELINEEIIKQKIEESGVIPRYREMALGVTRSVIEDPDFRRDLKRLVAEYLREMLGSEAMRQKLTRFAVQKIEAYAGEGASGLALRVYRFLNEADFQRRVEKAVDELPHSVDTALDELDALLDQIPEKIEARSEEIETWATRVVLGFVENLDVYGMVASNMQQYDERKLEQLIKNTTNEQLNYIKYLGGVLGFFGGLVIWQPAVALALFGTVGLLLYGLDVLLYRLRHEPDEAAAS